MRSEQRGFTLVEMLIGLVVLSFISLGTLTAMRTLGSTQERLTATTGRVDELRAVSQFLRDSLRQAMVPPPRGGGGTWGIPSPGLQLAQRDELVWLAPFDGAGGAGGLNYMRLYRQGSTLRLQFQPQRDEYDPASWQQLDEGNVLVEELENFVLQYRLGAEEPWINHIDTEEDLLNSLPALLKISVQARGRYWPDIVVSPDRGVL